MKYEPVIGLEVHAQLLTDTKMFCPCATKFGAEPNTQICPVCTGQPGALPVANKRAVEFAIRAGLATNCSIQRTSIFARKNYFYPDLPKGYQISQYDKPICEHGFIDIPSPLERPLPKSENSLSPCGRGLGRGEIQVMPLPLTPSHEGREDLGNSLLGENGQGEGCASKRISITRIHLEEDAGKFLHDAGGGSLVDYNRSGIPLIEIVSGPDIRSPEEGTAYLKTLRNILIYLGICDGNMQEGSFRVDANVSIRPAGSKKFGTRTELKNLNSFRAIERALAYEIARQEKILESGGKILQETLLWDDAKGATSSMRSKEEAHDYRYFPEPDLPPLVVENDWIENVRKLLPELASAKAARFVKEYGLPEYDAHVLTDDKALADYCESAITSAAQGLAKKISNWIMTELLRCLKNDAVEIANCKIPPQNLARLVESVESGKISGKIGKEVFEEMFKTGKKAEDIVREKGLVQVSDSGELEKIINAVLADNADNVAKYKSGKTGVFGHFVGEVMKATGGKANPKIVNEILKKKLS